MSGGRITYTLCADCDGAPLYEIAGSDAKATATGNVWVRFAEGIDARSRAEDLARAGYRIERVPGYAPNAAYVTADDVGTSLANMDALRALRDVEHVEPEMLTERTFRG